MMHARSQVNDNLGLDKDTTTARDDNLGLDKDTTTTRDNNFG